MNGKFSGVIRKAQEQQRHNNTEEQASIPDIRLSGIPDIETEAVVEFVNLSIRVPKPLRQHWAAEAKRQGTTLTKEISIGLERRFGKP